MTKRALHPTTIGKRRLRTPYVFINCPFDRQYAPTFRVLVFTVLACGYTPRCGLEEVTARALRLERLKEMIRDSPLGIHDLSRTGLSKRAKTPRFNMPYELGLFMGAMFYGNTKQRKKDPLVLARRRNQFDPAISDLSGLDPIWHGDRPQAVISALRTFFHTTPKGRLLPGIVHLRALYREFQRDLPNIARMHNLSYSEVLQYKNFVHFAWLYINSPARRGATR